MSVIGSDKKGSILILVLIVMTFLSALALQLGHIMRSRNMMVRAQREEIRSMYIAQGVLGKVIEAIENDRLDSSSDDLREEWVQRYYQRSGEPKAFEWQDENNDAGGSYSVMIDDEAGKLNINTAQLNELNDLFGTFERIDNERLAEQVFNYKEEKGQQKEFYSIHELLLIDGTQAGVFFGEDADENGYNDLEEENTAEELDHYDSRLEPGIRDYVTVFTDGKININTASRPVLLSMPGISNELADALMEHRGRKPFLKLDDLKEISLITNELFAQIVQWASVQSDWYKVTVKVKAQDSSRIKMIIAYIDRTDQRARIKYWREQ